MNERINDIPLSRKTYTFTLQNRCTLHEHQHHDDHDDDNISQSGVNTTSITIPIPIPIPLIISYKDTYIIRTTRSADNNNKYDYTGLRAWQGAFLLCAYISYDYQKFLDNASIHHDHHINGTVTIIELGAGVGICGLLLASLNQYTHNNSNNNSS